MRKRLIAVIGAIGISAMLFSACGNVRISIETDEQTAPTTISAPTAVTSSPDSTAAESEPESENTESADGGKDESRITPPADAVTPAEKEDSSAAPSVESTTPAATESVQAEDGGDEKEHPLTKYDLTPWAEKALEGISTDYHKVYWESERCADKDDRIVVSVARCAADRNMLVIGLTNLYDHDITIEAKGYAMDRNGNNVGDLYIFQSAIGPGQTVIRNQYCTVESDGRIHWDKMDLSDVNDESVEWKHDCSLVTESNGFYDVAYHITASNNEKIKADYVWALLLDDEGHVVRSYDGYNPDGDYIVGGAIKSDQKSMLGIDDIAFFANVHKA